MLFSIRFRAGAFPISGNSRVGVFVWHTWWIPRDRPLSQWIAQPMDRSANGPLCGFGSGKHKKIRFLSLSTEFRRNVTRYRVKQVLETQEIGRSAKHKLMINIPHTLASTAVKKSWTRLHLAWIRNTSLHSTFPGPCQQDRRQTRYTRCVWNVALVQRLNCDFLQGRVAFGIIPMTQSAQIYTRLSHDSSATLRSMLQAIGPLLGMLWVYVCTQKPA